MITYKFGFVADYSEIDYNREEYGKEQPYSNLCKRADVAP